MSSKRSRTAFEGSKIDGPPPHARYVLYGTALPPYEPNARDDGSFVPEWKQEVTDERGRKRFHGAFTGGFSAGYFNTVGSKDGFTPQTFVSSRAKKSQDVTSQNNAQQQRLEDFMDEEDLAEHAASQRLEVQDAFAGIGASDSTVSDEKLVADDDERNIFTKFFPSTNQESARPETKGHQLLRRMSWRPGQGIGARVRRRADGDRTGETHLFAPKDIPMIAFVRKNDYKGVGYGAEIKLIPISLPGRTKPAARRKFGLGASAAKTGDRGKVGSMHDTDQDDELDGMGPQIAIGRGIGGASIAKKKKKLDGIKSTPNRSVGPLSGTNTTTRVCHDGRPPLQGFVLSVARPVSPDPTSHSNPQIPPGWKSKKTPRDSAQTLQPSSTSFQSTSEAAKASTLDQKSRAALLGESLLPGKSVFDYLTPENRARIVAATGNVRLPAAGGEALPAGTTSASAGLQTENDRLWAMVPKLSAETAAGALARGEKGWLPYADDAPKRTRYCAFLQSFLGGPLSTQGGERPLPVRPPTSTIQEWAQELREFAAAAEVFRPATGLLGRRFAASTQDPSLPTASPNDDSTSAKEAAGAQREEDPAEKAASLGMHGHLTRSRERFYPSRLLCKRFGVRPPPDAAAGPGDNRGNSAAGDQDAEWDTAEGGTNVSTARLELVGRASLEKMMIEANLKRMADARATASTGEQSGEDAALEQIPANLAPVRAEFATVDPERNAALEQEKASPALFKAIFGDSDDEE